MRTELISYFKVAVKEDNKLNQSDLKRLISKASQQGYIIHPDCWNQSVLDWLDQNSVNYNSTFYKTWQEVISKDRLQLYIEQIISYAINYGMGGNFDMNDHDYSLVPGIRKYQVILPVTAEEMFVKCRDLIYTNIVLKNSTTDALCDYIAENYKSYKDLFDINKVSNKESMAKLCELLEITPTDPFNILRCMVYRVTNNATLIKDNATLRDISGVRADETYSKKYCYDMTTLSHDNLIALASIFYRFKPIFLAFKSQSTGNATVVNKIRKMAKKYHKPMKVGFWESIISNPTDIDIVLERLAIDKPTNFKLITLIQTIEENLFLSTLSEDADKFKMYKIRNGNVFVKNTIGENWSLEKMNWLKCLKNMLYDELVSRLRNKACCVKLPKELKLACPTSEKSFVGNIPFGSYFDMTEHNMIGIYWREEWGTRDFDLSLLDSNGSKIGWNGDFYLGNVVYSGDMTSANPEASEVIYIKSDCPDSMIMVNRFAGYPGSKFIMSVAQSSVGSLPRNYIMDPNTIKFQTEVTSKEKCEQIIGFICEKRLFICEFDRSNSRVSRACSGSKFIDVMKRKGMSFLDLERLLIDANFKIINDAGTETEQEILDLSELNKDTLINLFS